MFNYKLGFNYTSATYCKNTGKQKLRTRPFQNYDFVLTKLFKNEAEMCSRYNFKENVAISQTLMSTSRKMMELSGPMVSL